MDYQEQKLQRAFLTGTSKLEMAIRRDKLTVVDLSAFLQFKSLFVNFEDNKCREYESGFYHWWRENTDNDIVYCDETINEFLNFILGLKSIGNSCERRAKRYMGTPRLEGFETARSIYDSAIDAFDLLRDVIDPSIAENHIPDFIGSDLNEPELGNIYNALREIANKPGVIVDKVKKYKSVRKSKRAVNSKNDPKILSKVIGISYGQPVSLLCRDSDFSRMYMELVKNFGFYSGRFSIRVPLGDIEILELHRRGLTQFGKDGKREELSTEVEYDLQDIIPKSVL